MSISVAIIHYGYKDYLKTNLEISSKFNNIYLIGDKSLEKLGNIKNVNFINIEKYDKLINNKYYDNFINYSSNYKNFEWLCFKRVFILKLFLEDNKIDKIFHMDSDNILLYNINDYKFKKDIAYCLSKNYHKNRMSCSIHCSLLNVNFCNKFTELYEDIYINKLKSHLIKNKIKYHLKNKIFVNGGICDMTLYYLLNSEKIIDVENLLKPNDEYVFINNINNGEGDTNKNQYLMINKIIKLFKNKKNKKLFILDNINKKYHFIFNIHFQGCAKKLLNKNLVKYLFQ